MFLKRVKNTSSILRDGKIFSVDVPKEVGNKHTNYIEKNTITLMDF